MTMHRDRAARPTSVESRLSGLIRRFGRDESGATAIEYGLICSLIFLAIVSGVQGVANNTLNMYNKIQNNV
jgi:pilus assembly protein Flp/PilA